MVLYLVIKPSTTSLPKAYQENLKYDANGNIMNLLRTGNSGTRIDSLGYKYPTVPDFYGKYKNAGNRLTYVTDSADNVTGNDLVQQSSGNYRYDAKGRLTGDFASQIDTLKWTAYNKVKEVKRTSGSNQPRILFTYDANGRRISKKVIRSTTDSTQNRTTYYIYDAHGSLMSTYTKDFTSNTAYGYTVGDQPVYGLSRIGNYTNGNVLGGSTTTTLSKANLNFELTDHLGNVRAVVGGTKLSGAAQVASLNDYYAFGMQMPGRNFLSSNNYRYGFNGMEKDDEVAGSGNLYTTEWRELDTRLGGRWSSPDPIVKPWESPYAGFANNPIFFSDPEGLDPGPSTGGGGNPPVDNKAYDGGTLDEVVVTAPKSIGGGAVGGLVLDFMVRDRVDYRNTYYNPKVSEAKKLWQAGQLSDEAYSMYRYHAQKATKMQYRSAISKAMGEIPPTGKPLWQQKKLAEDISSGVRKISSNAGNTRGLTTKLATQTASKVIGRTLVVTGAAMSVYTVLTAEDQAKALTSEASGWGAAWGGAAVGASWGAAIGGPFAPITGAIGGVIGGGVGYYLGTQAGEAAYDAIKEY